MIGAIGAFIGVIITSVIVKPLVNRRNVDAKFHNTIEWRQILFDISVSPSIELKDILKLKSLVSPLNESFEDKCINALCNSVLESHWLSLSTQEDIRKTSRILLKLNWLKHGSGRTPNNPIHLHLYPSYMKTIVLWSEAQRLIHKINENIINGSFEQPDNPLIRNWFSITKIIIANSLIWTVTYLLLFKAIPAIIAYGSGLIVIDISLSISMPIHYLLSVSLAPLLWSLFISFVTYSVDYRIAIAQRKHN